MRGTFRELTTLLGHYELDSYNYHYNCDYRDAERKIRMDFFWNAYRSHHLWEFARDHRPSLMVSGKVLWYLNNDWDETIFPALELHRSSIREFANLARRDARDYGTQYVYRLDYPIIEDFPEEEDIIFNKRMDIYRRDAVEILKDYPEILVWSNVADYYESSYLRGRKTQWNARHPKTYEFEAQVVLNLFCNRFLNSSDRLVACCNGNNTKGMLACVFQPSLALKATLLVTMCIILRRLAACLS